MKSTVKVLLFFGLLLRSGVAVADIDDDRVFRTITASNGIADNSAQTIKCTFTGRMTITTIGSINFYDGANFSHINGNEELTYKLEDYHGHYHLYYDNDHQELYVFNPETGKALVWNYAADAWYSYEGFPMYRPFVFHGELYYGSKSGGIQHVSTEYAYDQIGSAEPIAIDCRWESGAMSFGMDYQRKYAAMIWLALKPETRSEVWVTVQTDKSSSYQEKVVSRQLFGCNAGIRGGKL
jgi:hypothetical protein